MRLAKVIEQLRQIAPERLAESWDKVGLQLGDEGWNVRKGLLCIDLTPAVLAEAIKQRVGLIVAYHPPIFDPLSALTSQDARQAMLLEAATRHIALYSPHTALDAAAGGVNDWLAGFAGSASKGRQHGLRAIRPTSVGSAGFKLVTFVPAVAAEKLRSALAQAGAGRIGDYMECSFTVSGEGTFRGGAASHPAIGKAGRFERISELRMEMFCPADCVAQVVTALRQTHPYEEPAFDLHALSSPPPKPDLPPVGQGRVLTLSQPLSQAQLIRRIKLHLGVSRLEVAWPTRLKLISRVGLCAGAGGSLLREAGPIDLFLTGEMRHHDVLAARERGIAVILAGHTQTERPYLPVYRRRIEQQIGPDVSWAISKADQPPSRNV